ncbi:hypothetical protein [Nocardioides sp. KR10-350]|uniref:hypothetical protein n=1 Tax=Nocardioides cheoyonin TaxID=3156615 RepID=UPI0032B44DEC
MTRLLLGLLAITTWICAILGLTAQFGIVWIPALGFGAAVGGVLANAFVGLRSTLIRQH